jgi:hypothetical protein
MTAPVDDEIPVGLEMRLGARMTLLVNWRACSGVVSVRMS